MALRRRFLPVFKKHAPRGKPRFAKPLQGHFGPAAKHSQKHKNRPKIGRFSHFNPSAEMHPFSLFSASKAPQKWLCDAICRKKQLFAGSFGSRSHSFCSFTLENNNAIQNMPLVRCGSSAKRACNHIGTDNRLPLWQCAVRVRHKPGKGRLPVSRPLPTPAAHPPVAFPL